MGWLVLVPEDGQLLGPSLVVPVGSLGELSQTVHHLAQAPPHKSTLQ